MHDSGGLPYGRCRSQPVYPSADAFWTGCGCSQFQGIGLGAWRTLRPGEQAAPHQVGHLLVRRTGGLEFNDSSVRSGNCGSVVSRASACEPVDAAGENQLATINSFMSLIVVGSVAYDGVETPHGKVDRMLGGAATYIALSASYFTPVKIVAVVGDDFAKEDVDLLESRKIDLEGLERVAGGKTFFWAGVYSADMNDRTTLRTDLNVFADFDPKLPAAYRAQPYLLLGNIQPDLQRAVRAQMNGLRLVGGDTMNYWIADHRAELLKTIAEWDFLLINDSEPRMLSGENNLIHAAATILQMGPHTLVISHGQHR